MNGRCPIVWWWSKKKQGHNVERMWAGWWIVQKCHYTQGLQAVEGFRNCTTLHNICLIDKTENADRSEVETFPKKPKQILREMLIQLVMNVWKCLHKLTFPKIVCLLLSSSAGPNVKKNWLPLSWGPAFAIATNPLLLKRNREWNSSCNRIVKLLHFIISRFPVEHINKFSKWFNLHFLNEVFKFTVPQLLWLD